MLKDTVIYTILLIYQEVILSKFSVQVLAYALRSGPNVSWIFSAFAGLFLSSWFIWCCWSLLVVSEKAKCFSGLVTRCLVVVESLSSAGVKRLSGKHLLKQNLLACLGQKALPRICVACGRIPTRDFSRHPWCVWVAVVCLKPTGTIVLMGSFLSVTPITLISPGGGGESYACMHKEASRAGPVVAVGSL